MATKSSRKGKAGKGAPKLGAGSTAPSGAEAGARPAKAPAKRGPVLSTEQATHQQ